MKTLKISILFLAVLLLVSFKVDSKEKQGIVFFEGTLEEAMQLAQKENKPIFMDAYASWCGPCKMIAKRVFTKEEVGIFYNKNFINVKIDMEKGEGSMLARKYGVRAYPTLLFLDKKGEVLGKSVGYHTGKALLDVGKQALELNK